MQAELVHSLNSISLSEPYLPRRTEFKGVWHDKGWNFKIYTITHSGNREADGQTLDIAKNKCRKLRHGGILGKYSPSTVIHGLGYIILHKSKDTNYIVISWWVGENRLCKFVFFSTPDKPYQYKNLTSSGMTSCVWDAVVHHFENNLWINEVMKKSPQPDIKSYLEQYYTGELYH